MMMMCTLTPATYRSVVLPAATQKEEAGEVRHEVDFEQLKIENKQFSERFEEKNQELLRLKLSAGNTMQVLNTFKVGWERLGVTVGLVDREITPILHVHCTSVCRRSCML